MKRRTFVNHAAYGGASALLLSTLLSSCKSKGTIKPIVLPEGATYKMDYLSGNVGYFSERGGTIVWMSDKKGIVIVDTQFQDQASNLNSQLKKLSKNRVDAVINTHHHGDHTSGNIVFKDLTDQIIAHENSRKNQERVAKERDKMKETILPNTTFKNNYTINVGNEKISMNYFGAAHTDGDIVVHFENAGVVHMGDLIFNRRFPYIDMSSDANIQNWISALDKTLAFCPIEAKFVFGHSDNGHGVVGNQEDIKAFQNYLERLMEFGNKCKKEGLSLEEALANTTQIIGAEEWKGKGIEKSIKAVYQELGMVN